MKIQGPNKIIIAKKKKKKGLICWLDMDGVISFFEKSAAKTIGIDLEDNDIREKIKTGTRISSFIDGGESAMWSKIDAEGIKWWRDMELLPWGMELYKKLKEKGDYFSFLTSPGNNSLCSAGKVEFLQKHFGDDFQEFLIGKHKEYCASSSAILVDDSESKIKKFRAFGGHAFKWPSPLSLIDNDVNVDETIDELIEYIENLKK